MEASAFGTLLKRYRLEAGLTQEELAEKALISARAISDLERGVNRTARRDTVRQLIAALDLVPEQRAALEAAGRDAAGQAADDGHGADDQTTRIRTFLIIDARGYTSFTQEHGDEAGAQLAARFAHLVEETVAQWQGQLIELRGDEALVVFSSARQALRATVELQVRFDDERERAAGLPVHVGMGLDAGEAVPVKGGYRGRALNLAARLCDLAGRSSTGRSEAFCTETVITLAGRVDGLAYVDRGEVQLKHLSGAVRVIQVGREAELPPILPPLHHASAPDPSNLPDEPTPFIGREREIAAATALLRRSSVRLVTLTGAGGTGKTRLALQLGRRVVLDYPEGAIFVSLASISDPQLVPSVIAQALGVRELSDQPLVEALKAYLREKRLLLILDNFEHVLLAAPVVAQLLDACPRVDILVTSREALRLSWEHQYAVPPLDIPDVEHLPGVEGLVRYDAVALFVERASAIRADFELRSEIAGDVARICHRLDGLPLAIELAATHVKLFPPQALLKRLERRLPILTGGARDLPDRHRTLRSAMDWSYTLLHARQKRLFARLAVFVGGCTLEAIDAVCNAEDDLEAGMLDGVASLVEKGLLRQEGQDEPIFLMLATIREYAREHLEASGELAIVQERHARYYVHLLQKAEPHIWGGEEQVRWLQRLDQEHDNIRAALAWACGSGVADIGLRLAVGVYPMWLIRGHLREGRRWLADLLVLEGSQSNEVAGLRVQALAVALNILHQQGEIQEAQSIAEEALQLSHELGNKDLIAQSMIGLGQVVLHLDELDKAETLIEEARSLSEEVGNVQITAWALDSLAAVARARGKVEQVSAFLEESLACWRRLDNTWGMALELSGLASWAFVQGDLDRAQSLAEESLALHRALQIRNGAAQAARTMGFVARARGEYQQAAALYKESLSMYRDLGDRRNSATLLYNLSLQMREQGDYQQARELGEESLALQREIGAKGEIAVSLLGLGDLARDEGDIEHVITLCKESLALGRATGNSLAIGFSLNNLALAARAQGDYGRAMVLLEEGIALYRRDDLISGVAELLISLGLVAHDQGDDERAQEALAEGARLAQMAGPPWVLAAAWEGMAGVALAQGKMERATTLLAAADALRVSINVPVRPVDRSTLDNRIAEAKRVLGEEGFGEMWREGRAMTLEQAIVYALEAADQQQPAM